MAPVAGEETRVPGRRPLIAWLVLLGLLVAAFIGTVAILNNTLYSASGFVGSYLNTLVRHDVAAALATPGMSVARTDAERDALLAPEAMAQLRDIRLVSDTDRGNGAHRVVYEYRIGEATGRTTFDVEHTGVRLGLFSAWRFTTSPSAVLQVTPLHAADFTANGVDLTSENGPGKATPYQVLTPALVVLTHDSTYLTAKPTGVLVENPGRTVNATVDVQASPDFVKQLQKQLDATLDACVTQQVLQPTGCPFGKQMDNRIDNLPVWSMSVYPKLTIVPGDKAGTWIVPKTPGAAHLKVRVLLLFDGSISQFDEDVPFTVSYLITFPGDGPPTITAQP